MKNRIILLTIAALACVIMYLAINHLQGEIDEPMIDSPFPPSHMVAIGPVGREMVYTEMNGPYVYTMQTEQQHFKRAKVLGFESNLVKKLVLKKLVFSISKGDETILAFEKDSVEMQPNIQSITVDNPTILVPAGLAKPDKIRIDKTRQMITLFYGKHRKVWKLQ